MELQHKKNNAPTLSDVARKAGVSLVTASTVVNASRSNTRVSAATRARILDAATALNYHPNALARGLLRQQTTKTLGVLFGLERASVTVTNPYAFMVLEGIAAAAATAGYNVTLFTQPWHGAAVSAAPLRDGRTDGIIVIAPANDSDVVSSLAALEIPLVSVSASGDRHAVPSVDVDNVCGARLATEFLLSLGHRRIAHLQGDSNLLSAKERCDTFCQTLLAAGVPVRQGYILAGSYERASGYENTQRLMQLPERPTAIFACNDNAAIGVLEAARDAGVRVPDALSVVGFDDIPLPSLVTPTLTTIRQPLAEIGARATRLLIALLAGEDVAPTTVLYTPELVVRGSTAPPAPT